MGPSALASFAGAAILDTTPTVIQSIITKASPEQLAWRPNEERWSIEMVLAHLAHVEVNGFRSRFRVLSQQENPLLVAYDQLEFFDKPRKFDAWRDLQAFAEARAETLDLLRSIPASMLERSGRHEELQSDISFGELLNELAFHDLGHIRQIAELYRAKAFYPHMGPFRGYYTINP